jgi:hypothetical protein
VTIGAFGAALVHLIGHGLYKAAAFLGAGGRVSARARARHRQLPTVVPSRAVVLTGRVALPLAAPGAAFALIQPGFGPAKTLLVAVLLAVTLGHLLAGWLATAPVGPARSLAIGAVTAPVLGSAYLGGIVLVETAMGAALPTAGPAAIGVLPLAAVLATVAGLVLALRAAPSSVRAGVHAWLVGVGTAPARRAGTTTPRRARTALPPVHASASAAQQAGTTTSAVLTSAVPIRR